MKIEINALAACLAFIALTGCQKGMEPEPEVSPAPVAPIANDNQSDSSIPIGNGTVPVAVTGETISSAYPNDVGIANDSRVLLAENFEGKTLSQVLSRWTSVKNPAGMSIENDHVPGAQGQSVLRMNRIDPTSTAATADQTGGYLWMRLDQLNKTNVDRSNGDQLYLRYYLKIDPDTRATYHHTGGGIGGVANIQNWPVGQAGVRPTGSDRFSTRVEVDGKTGNDFRVDFYTYWMGMHHNATVPEYYGNSFVWDNSAIFSPGAWTCIEYTVKLNNPVSALNGEQRLWVNNREVGHFYQGSPQGKWLHDTFLTLGSDGYVYNQANWAYPMSQSPLTYFEGFQWRNTTSLKLNYLSIEYYTTKDEANGAPYLGGKVWWDNIVLATSRIGCTVAQ